VSFLKICRGSWPEGRSAGVVSGGLLSPRLALPGLVALGMMTLGLALWARPVAAVELGPGSRQSSQLLGPVAYCADPDWAPFEVITPAGEHQGIAADLLQLVATRAGVALTLVRTRDWDESLAAFQQGRCDLLSFLNQTPKRSGWLSFTDPVFIDRNVIVTHEDHPFVADLAALAGETMVLPKGTSIEERVRRDFPQLTIRTTESEDEAFALVSSRKADLTLRSLTVAVYTIKQDGWFNLKIAGQVPGYDNQLRIGVRPERQDLLHLLNQAVATLTLAERETIANRHVAIKVQTGVDQALVRRLIYACALIALTSLFWIVKLNRLNERLRRQSLTDNLTGLANREHLNQRLEQELERCRRYGRPLALVLFDVDYFKQVNDTLGHLAGDRVLVALAGVARAQVRGSDLVGRWGGEEFLILCPETSAEQALVLAERLVQATREHDFATGQRHTVSAGVASLRPEDSADSLLQRADLALYRAKDGGRDRVCAAA